MTHKFNIWYSQFLWTWVKNCFFSLTTNWFLSFPLIVKLGNKGTGVPTNFSAFLLYYHYYRYIEICIIYAHHYFEITVDLPLGIVSWYVSTETHILCHKLKKYFNIYSFIAGFHYMPNVVF